jgi:hypothetical protein
MAGRVIKYDTAMETLSITKRKAERLIADLLKLDLIVKCEFQHEKDDNPL